MVIAEALFDLAFQINPRRQRTTPSVSGVEKRDPPEPFPGSQLLLLCRAQQTGWIRRATVEQAIDTPSGIVTVGPIPQLSAAIHEEAALAG